MILLGVTTAFAVACGSAISGIAADAPPKKPAAPVKNSALPYPPVLPDAKTIVTDTSDDFLKPPETLKPGVAIAKVAPTVDFAFFPGQTYPGNIWSTWGDSLAANGKYYASLGDHAWPSGCGFVYEYDPAAKSFRLLADVKKTLALPEGDYVPGKIHGRLDLGSDGCLYFSTHRGSAKATTEKYHYRGDWILKCDPKTAKTEIVVQGPVPKHCIPNTVLDPQRLIFYGGTAAGGDDGGDEKGVQFFAYDVKNAKLLYSGPNGPSRSMIFAKSTGRVYYVPGNQDGQLMRFDPAKPTPEPVTGKTIGVRAATEETPQGLVYTASLGQRAADANLWSFNTKTEEVKDLGPAAVASQAYIATLDADPTGRYLYYIPGAHGSSDRDGAAVVQFDTKTNQKKVIAFLHPFYQAKYGFTLKGTYSVAVDPAGDKLYITWNISRGSKAWDCVGLTVLHIPEAERKE
jgi:hypothetical protein